MIALAKLNDVPPNTIVASPIGRADVVWNAVALTAPSADANIEVWTVDTPAIVVVLEPIG